MEQEFIAEGRQPVERGGQSMTMPLRKGQITLCIISPALGHAAAKPRLASNGHDLR